MKKWNDAFRVYASIYAHANPTRSTEIWEYVHSIHMASSAYHIDNVMYYDYEFRRIMAEHPERSWATINTQLWAMAMRHPIANKQNNSYQPSNKSGKTDFRETCCWKYNRNKCTRGAACKFEHRCSYCGSSQHIFYGCPKRNSKKESRDKGEKGDRQAQQDANK